MFNYEEYFPAMPVYVSKSTGEISENLARLLSKEPTLTFDSMSNTGFKEIDICDKLSFVPVEKKWVEIATEKSKLSLRGYANLLLANLEKVLFKTWDNKHTNIVATSGGADSRILSWTLASIREKHGKDFLGNIVFLCHHNEGSLFEAAMKQQGWNKGQYHIHKREKPQNSEYYDYGLFDDNHNAYTALWFNFWSDVVPKEKENEANIILGYYGGEQFDYPPRLKQINENRIIPLMEHMKGNHYSLCRYILKFNSVVLPYMHYSFLADSLDVPENFFVLTKRMGVSIDIVRNEMLSILGDKTPTHFGHQYDFTITPKTAEQMKKAWVGSKLLKDFKENKLICSAKPWIAKRDSFDNKLYALATCYERTTR